GDLRSFPTRRSSDLKLELELLLPVWPFRAHRLMGREGLAYQLRKLERPFDGLERPALDGSQVDLKNALRTLVEQVQPEALVEHRSEEHTSELQSREK